MADTKVVGVRLNEEEIKEIERNAKVTGQTINTYMKDMALNKCVLNFEYEKIEEHTREILELKKQIKSIVETAIKFERIYDPDIDRLIAIMDEILKTENELLYYTRKERDNQRKLVRKEIRKIVDKSNNKVS